LWLDGGREADIIVLDEARKRDRKKGRYLWSRVEFVVCSKLNEAFPVCSKWNRDPPVEAKRR
jgi:hypothetical protein